MQALGISLIIIVGIIQAIYHATTPGKVFWVFGQPNRKSTAVDYILFAIAIIGFLLFAFAN